MAASPNPPLIPVDQYLNSSYHPDLEYVDGLLVERSVPTIAHSLLQALLIAYLRTYRLDLRFAVLPEVRTRIVERARYRIPDVLLCPLPLPAGKVLTTVPWAVLEILSPDDRLPEQLQRFRDYEQIGVPHVILLDPEQHIAFRFQQGSLHQTAFTTIELPSGSLPFDTQALFQQFIEECTQTVV